MKKTCILILFILIIGWLVISCTTSGQSSESSQKTTITQSITSHSESNQAIPFSQFNSPETDRQAKTISQPVRYEESPSVEIINVELSNRNANPGMELELRLRVRCLKPIQQDGFLSVHVFRKNDAKNMSRVGWFFDGQQDTPMNEWQVGTEYVIGPVSIKLDKTNINFGNYSVAAMLGYPIQDEAYKFHVLTWKNPEIKHMEVTQFTMPNIPKFKTQIQNVLDDFKMVMDWTTKSGKETYGQQALQLKESFQTILDTCSKIQPNEYTIFEQLFQKYIENMELFNGLKIKCIFGGVCNPEFKRRAHGYNGIWYYNQPSNDEYKYKYSGGLGTYCAKHIPLGYYAAEVNKTFFVYGGKSEDDKNLLEMVSVYDHATGKLERPLILHNKETTDAHDNPVLMLDNQGYIFVFCSSHGTSRPSFIYKSLHPYSIEKFVQIKETNFSYPQPWWIANKGFLFLHTKYTEQGRVLHYSTSQDAINWSDPKPIAAIGEGHYQVSWRYENKVGTAFNYHPQGKGLNYRTNIYYVESDDYGKTWKTITGELLTLPLVDSINPALVHDFQSEGLNVYMKDLAFDPNGKPVILVVTSKGYESGPENGPRQWTTVQWTGTDWEIRAQIQSDSNYDTGCLYIEPDGIWRLIGPTETGPQPFNPGGEVAMWTSEDQGKHWNMIQQLTTNSTYNHTYCRKLVHAHPDFYSIWADGHARMPSESRLYFCNQAGTMVFQMPMVMEAEQELPPSIPIK